MGHVLALTAVLNTVDALDFPRHLIRYFVVSMLVIFAVMYLVRAFNESDGHCWEYQNGGTIICTGHVLLSAQLNMLLYQLQMCLFGIRKDSAFDDQTKACCNR